MSAEFDLLEQHGKKAISPSANCLPIAAVIPWENSKGNNRAQEQGIKSQWQFQGSRQIIQSFCFSGGCDDHITRLTHSLNEVTPNACGATRDQNDFRHFRSSQVEKIFGRQARTR